MDVCEYHAGKVLKLIMQVYMLVPQKVFPFLN